MGLCVLAAFGTILPTWFDIAVACLAVAGALGFLVYEVEFNPDFLWTVEKEMGWKAAQRAPVAPKA